MTDRDLLRLPTLTWIDSSTIINQAGIILSVVSQWSLYSPFVVSPSTSQPFVLSLSKETAEILRAGLSNP